MIVGVAVAGEEPIVPAEIVIDARVERVRVVVVEPIDGVVVVQPALGRCRIRLQQRQRVTDAVGRRRLGANVRYARKKANDAP